MNLEDDIEELEKVDRLRIESASVRDQGRDALREYLRVVKVEEARAPSKVIVEAPLIKALCDRRKGPPADRVQELESLTAEKILYTTYDIPVLRAARSMQALAAAPDSAFSEALLVFYYQIVRELYTADAPDWRIGGARAAVGASASAFVTGECVHAILGFARTLENTGSFVEQLRLLRRRKEQLETRATPPNWCKVELDRLRRDFYTSVVRLLDNIALKLDQPENPEGRKLLPLRPDSIDDFIAEAPQRLGQAVSRTVDTFESVTKKIEEFRQMEGHLAREEDDWLSIKEGERLAEEPASAIGTLRRGQQQKHYQRSETGHSVALEALQQGLANAKAVQECTAGGDLDLFLEKLAAFKVVARRVRSLLHPAQSYLSTILDQELTAASSGGPARWDPAEMTFAATAYGFAAGNFQDERLRRAGRCLAAELSERGRFRSGRPFNIDREGGHYDVLGAEVLRVFAQLLEEVDEVPVEDGLVKRMLAFFEDTRKAFEEVPGFYGWSTENAREPAKASLGVTTHAVLALDRVNRMLDTRINARVFRHFTVKRDHDLKVPRLRDLFFPDYGLRHPAVAPEGETSWQGEESVALTLERLRTHVLGLSRREKPVPPLFSLILYGPPGTGKTTFVESLAKSAEVPLVEITPSDIVSSGADVVERRARAVFKALSLLTRAVVLFDEFDPVLKRRNPDDRETSTVFSFVTPGMLPKLKTLHDRAKDRSVAYVLLTNLIGILDGAAVRSGRFDRKLGIYAPDPLSRQGRLLDEALAFQPDRDQWPADLEERVRTVVQKTRRSQIEALTREGWFRRPEGSIVPSGCPFEYLSGAPRAEFEPEAEMEPQPPPKRAAPPSEADAAEEREYLQRYWLWEWENAVQKAEIPQELESLLDKPGHAITGARSSAPSPVRSALHALAGLVLSRGT
jgi:hypothetical protein